MRAWIAVVLVMVALSGCFKGDAAKPDYEGQAWAAMERLTDDFRSGGEMKSVLIQTSIPTGTAIPLPVSLTAALGAGDDILLSTDIAGVSFRAYCGDESIVMLLKGGENYGLEEIDQESRNLYGDCIDPNNSALAAAVDEYVDIRGLLMILSGDGLQMVKAGKGQEGDVEAEFHLTVPATKTEPKSEVQLTVVVTDGRIEAMESSSDVTRLTVSFTYGPRDTLVPPTATQRLATAISASTKVDGPEMTWTATTGEGGPYDEYSFVIFDANKGGACGDSGAVPKAVFRLADGATQSTGEFSFIFLPDDDDTMGKGDQAIFRHSDLSKSFKFPVFLWDDWANMTAAPSCGAPGLGAVAVVGVVAVLGLVRRRFT